MRNKILRIQPSSYWDCGISKIRIGLLVLAFITQGWFVHGQATSNLVQVIASSNTIPVGGTVTISVLMSNNTDPYTSWGLFLRFNTNFVVLQQQSDGSLANVTYIPDGRGLGVINGSQQVRAGGAKLGNQLSIADGILGNFQFQVIAPGSNVISTELFSNSNAFGMKLKATSATNIFPNLIEDKVVLNAVGPAPLPEVDVIVNGVSIASGQTNNFGTGLVGNNSQQVFVITNQGDANLTVANLGVTGAGFSLASGPTAFTLGLGESTNVTVQYSRTIAGTQNGLLAFDNNDGNENPYQINLIGTATNAPGAVLLTNLVISPAAASILTNTTVSLMATGYYDNGTVSNVTGQTAWNSLAPAVASVDTNGVVSGLSAGIALIEGSLGGLTNVATVTVTNGGGTGPIGVIGYNSGDLTADGYGDVLAYRGGAKGGVRLLDNLSNALESANVNLERPSTKAKVLAANRVGGTNYVAYKVGKTTVVNSYQVTNTMPLIGTIYNNVLSKGVGKVLASGDLNNDGVLDLVSVKKKNVYAVYGPGYSATNAISGVLVNNKLPGRVAGMYTETGTNWVLLFQKGKQNPTTYNIVSGSNLVVTAGPTISSSGKILGMSGSVPITQKGKVITAGTFTFTNTKTNNVGKAVAPK